MCVGSQGYSGLNLKEKPVILEQSGVGSGR